MPLTIGTSVIAIASGKPRTRQHDKCIYHMSLYQYFITTFLQLIQHIYENSGLN